MTIRKIVVPVHGTRSDEPCLRTAGAAAARLSARIEAVFTRHDPREALPFATGYVARDLEERFATALAERDTAAHAKAEALIGALRDDPKLAAVVFNSYPGPIEDAVMRRARCADLVVASPYRSDEPAGRRRAREAALFDSGRPVLIAPPETDGTVGARCVVAWDGSAVAARAIASALPFLKQAEAVTLLVIDAEEPVRDTEEIAAYLDLHGAEAQILRVPVEQSIGRTLVGQSAAVSADLLVMGAYGHTWLRQQILGGTTRSVMLDTPIAVLMAH